MVYQHPIQYRYSIYLEKLGCFSSSMLGNEPELIIQIQMKTFLVCCGDLDEEGFLVEAPDIDRAREEALKQLGWYVVQDDGEEEE